MATLADVANEANVSAATVSRVLNGSYSVTDEKRQRVMDAIDKVGYQLPARLRQIVPKLPDIPEGKKNLILVILTDPIDSILIPFQFTAQAYGFNVLAYRYISHDDLPYLETLLKNVSPTLAGILLLNGCDNSPAFQALLEPYPLVQVGEAIMENTYNVIVYNDEIRMSQDATDYLFAQGCRTIGILVPPPQTNTSLFLRRNRLNGYYLSLIGHSVPIDEDLVGYVDVSVDGGYEGAKRLLEKYGDRLDAIIGATDVVAQGAIYAIRRAGHTTDDIRVFSLDNNEVWDFSPCTIPYIDPHHEEIGYTAFHILHATINKEIQRNYRCIVSHSVETAGSSCRRS